MLLEVKGSNESVYFLAPVFQKERGRGWVGGRERGVGCRGGEREESGRWEREKRERNLSS